MRKRFIIERRDPDGGNCDARKYADRQLFKLSRCCYCCLEYRLRRALLQYSIVNRINYPSVRLTSDSARYCGTGATNASRNDDRLDESKNNSQTSLPDEGNMECSRSIPKFVCSICGSRSLTIKIEERVEESTTCEIVEGSNVDNDRENWLRSNDDYRRVPFPEAGVDIVDRKLTNTEESLEKEIEEYHSDDNDVLTYTESWTENWLFRKKYKRDKAAATADVVAGPFQPVTMFVPNTSVNYRAMIGDQNVDEISELSECSDYSDDLDKEEEFKDVTTTTMAWRKVGNGVAKYIHDQRNRVLLDGKSKHHREYNIALGKEFLLDREDANGYSRLNSLQVPFLGNPNRPSHVSHCRYYQRSRKEDIRRCIADEDKKALQKSFDSTAFSDKRLVADQHPNDRLETNRSYKTELFIETRDVNQNSPSDDKLSDIDFCLFSPPKPGTIADREHRKWQTAAPIDNNPYSGENLQKRLTEQKCAPKYCSASSLLGIARINGLDDGKTVDTAQPVTNDVDFETMDLSERSSFDPDNNTPIVKESNNADDMPKNKSSETKSIVRTEVARVKESKANGSTHNDVVTKNKSRKSKCTNSEAIKVTKKNATINEVDYYSCFDSYEEKISLPSVKRLVEVFSRIEQTKDIVESLKPKDKNTRSGDTEQRHRRKFKRAERPGQSPRPLHLHSLTARSLSKEFREGLR